jgi:hypothetical protein
MKLVHKQFPPQNPTEYQNDLNKEWNDRLPLLWIIRKLGTIFLVFTNSPDGHLVKAGQGED